MHDQHNFFDSLASFVADMIIFTSIAHIAHVLAAIPPWVGGAVSIATVRLAEPTLRGIGDRIAKRFGLPGMHHPTVRPPPHADDAPAPKDTGTP